MTHEISALPIEARPFQGKRAGIVSRVISNSVDFAVIVLVLIGIYASWSAFVFLRNPPGFTFPSPSFFGLFVIDATLLIAYFTAAWATTGRTYGDHLMGLRVINFRGDRLRWIGALLRAGFCVFFPIGLFWVVISNQNRSVQDVVLRTSVIYDWRPKQPRANSRDQV